MFFTAKLKGHIKPRALNLNDKNIRRGANVEEIYNLVPPYIDIVC